jgi:ribonuclease P protein subunit RPR2
MNIIDSNRDVKMRSSAKQIARQRIQVLFQQAKSVYHSNPPLSSHYIETARKIAMATKIRLPLVNKRQICKKCNVLLVPGDNCRVRIRQRRESHVVVTCLHCGYKTRILLRRNKEKTKLEQDNYSNETPR